jgi:uncharacterized protein (DUF362 family)
MDVTEALLSPRAVSKARVALLRTSARNVLHDYHRLLNLADYQQALPKDADTALAISLGWHFFYPASSTTPWQLEGVIRAMQQDGYNSDLIHACQHASAVIDAHLGERENKQIDVLEAHGLRNVHLSEGEEWVDVRDVVPELAGELLCLNRVYPDGFAIPKRLLGANVMHLPTVKTDIATGISGAMSSALGGLLDERRHWSYPVAHEALVDLLMIQKRVHRGLFAVMDGTFAGDGPGPRCLVPHVKNVILASADLVALDAVAGHLMGFDPLRDLPFVQLAHERGLGCGEIGEIEVVGDPQIMDEEWQFQGPFANMTLAARNQQRVHRGRLKKPFEWSLRTPLATLVHAASVAYHDAFWYPTYAKEHMGKVRTSDWGRLFANWGEVRTDARGHGYPDVGVQNPDLTRSLGVQLAEAMRQLGKAVIQAPEWRGRKRSKVA